MSLQLPGDFAAKIVKKAHETIGERYGDSMVENCIPRIFEVRPASEMSHGLYHRETQIIHDGVPVERELGDAIDPGHMREEVFVIHKKRFHARKYEIPREMLEYAKLGGDRALGSMENWAADKGREFADKRFEAEQVHAANVFNKGGFTAGADVFNNSVKGLEADPGGKLLYDGVELFNLTGNARTAVNGTTYYNAAALALSSSNLETVENLVADTNGYTETGDRLNTMPDLLLVAQALRSTAHTIVRARQGRAGTANNDANPQEFYDICVWPYLTDADGWFIGKARTGLVWWQDDMPPTVEFQYDATRRTDCLFVQSCYGAQVRPSGWRFWGASNISTS